MFPGLDNKINLTDLFNWHAQQHKANGLGNTLPAGFVSLKFWHRRGSLELEYPG